jgi:hypothetical protein
MPTDVTDARNARAENLQRLNGIEMVLVNLPGGNKAELEVQFYNASHLPDVLAAAGTPDAVQNFFWISGGARVRAGNGDGEVRVTAVAAGSSGANNTLKLTVEPIGDYSTYTLHAKFQAKDSGNDYELFDPFFSEIDFKFRPGCFSTDCAPEWCRTPAAQPEPAIDYMAKDYDSFKHTLISAMMQRVPGWRPTSEADLDQVLIELFSAAADELSDYQDRVMNEAYLATARKRVSLARLARLVDYHIHQGNQASTWLAFEVGYEGILPAKQQAGTRGGPSDPRSQVFVTQAKPPIHVHHLLNGMHLYTWSDAKTTLAAGSTMADLFLDDPTSKAEAEKLRDMIRDGTIERLLVQEHKNPKTGREPGTDPTKRQLLTLVRDGAEVIHDPDPGNPTSLNAGTWVIRVRWREKLKQTYCFVDEAGVVNDVALFHGNLARAYHGRPHRISFAAAGKTANPPKAGPPNDLEPRNWERLPADDCHPVDECSRKPRARGAICRMPDDEPLLYRIREPGSDVASISTLELEVDSEPWEERPDLIHSDDGDESGHQFVVETDEKVRSLIRFGNGVNGSALGDEAQVDCYFQSGWPLSGNVGADSINGVAPSPIDVRKVWNPFDVTDGRAPEPRAEIVRRAPEAYAAHQLRAITLDDYVRRAEEVEGVSRAAARYAWTGSWRTVQIAIDPLESVVVDAELRRRVSQHLESVRLIGEDLEIRPPIFVPLKIDVSVCIDSEHWPRDVLFVVQQELSDGFTRDGRMAFFNPDRWTFGQSLHVSELEGVIQQIEGVDHVISVKLQRWDAATPGPGYEITVRANEIILVQNDPDHMEKGSIEVHLEGGRR